ncbi:MAG: enoyl-CoA hydratase/isomerase family protein [Deltaproteobacteria bacterium]|nr:enoyl-CoA hydratase/isomerase family protein [Deltaproteobacteria bacterium]
MEYSDLVVKREGSLAKVTLNRPEVLNTLSVRMLKELKQAAAEFKDDPAIRVVILTGGSSMFTAGLDLKDPEVKKMLSGNMAERRERVTLGPRTCQAIEGFCVGGGVSLVISCDFRVMGQSAFMLIPEISLGMNYSWGSIPRLIHLIGPAKAKEMILLGEQVPAQKCLTWGLAEQVVPAGSSMEAAEAMAEKILKKPPIPVAMTKQAVTRITAALDQTGIYMDADQFLLTTYTEDHKEGVKAFLDKKPPRFKGK